MRKMTRLCRKAATGGAGSASRAGSKARSHDRGDPGMKKASNTALAIGAGYLLGRKHKLRLALVLATATATGRLGGAATQAVKRGGSLLGASDAMGTLSPDLGKVMSTVRGDLAGAGKAAVQAAVASRIESLTDSLHERTEGLRNPPEPDEPGEEEEEEAEQGEPDEPHEPDRRGSGGRPRGRGRGESRPSARRDSERPRRREHDDPGSDRPRRRREPESSDSKRPARRPSSDGGSGSPSARRRGK